MLLPEAAALDLGPALAHFAEHGWARLGPALAPEGVAALQARADALMLGEVRREGMFFQRDAPSGSYDDLTFGKGWTGPGLDYRKLEKLELDPLFLAWIDNPLFERVARALIPGDIAIYRSTLFAKAASGGTLLPWHQDGGRFWGIDRDPFLQVWTALDDAPPEAGCVEVVSGTHRAGLVTPNGGQIAPGPLAEARAEERALPVPAKAGEVLLIHNHLWHRSGRNRSGHPRRALSVCYMSAATRCVRKRHAPRTFFRVFVPRG